MAKVRLSKLGLSKLNGRWVTPLVLASIALHGLVLALPMPNLVEETLEPPEPTDPEVIKVVTLPKLATTPDSPEEPFIPEAPEPLPEEPPPVEEPVDELVLAEPEIVDELELEPVETEVDNPELNQNPPMEEGGFDEQPTGMASDQSEDNRRYEQYNSEQVNNQTDYLALSAAWEPRVRDEFEISEDEAAGYLKEKDFAQPPQPFSPSVCLDNEPSSRVTVGIVLDENGMLVSEPELFSHTGYPELDNEVIEFARGLNYTRDQEDEINVLKPYWFEVKIVYESCAQA